MFFSITDLPRDGPHISGEEKQYQIGDVLNLNCTSGKSHPAPLVEWLINDVQVNYLYPIIKFNISSPYK